MGRHKLRILQVNTRDSRGGAAQLVWNLHQSYKLLNQEAWMAVGEKFSDDPKVIEVPNYATKSYCARSMLKVANNLDSLRFGSKPKSLLREIFYILAEPRTYLDTFRGIEDFNHPGTWKLLDLFPEPPDIIHCHNLHGGYFDLRALPWLNQNFPIVATLNDTWLLSGHCAHFFDCDRWRMGCGQCPDLTIYPAIRRDATALNWQRKHHLGKSTRLYIATPSKWLMEKVKESLLIEGAAECRVIPNGVSLSIFHPADKRIVRASLNIPQGARVLLFAATNIRRNVFKDYQTIKSAITLLADRLRGQDVRLIALGEDAPVETIGSSEVRFVPYQTDPGVVAQYYEAADVYVHAAHAEVWGLAITEALACGTPVVATAVGGISEQVKAVDWPGTSAGLKKYSLEEATGFLVPAGDASTMAEAIAALLDNEEMLVRLGENAAQDARARFDLKHQAAEYLGWYQAITGRKSNINRTKSL